MTLVEIMVAFTIFTIVAGGVAGTLIQSRKFAEINIYQVTAQTIAQSIIEQVQLMPYAILAEMPVAASTPVPLHFVGASSENTALMQEFSLRWAPDEKTFTAVGEVIDTTTKGVLLDMDYRTDSAVVVRGKKYMQMQVNLQKKVNDANGNVVVILTYKWELPNRKSGAIKSLVYETHQLRTVRSQTPSF